MRKGNGEKGLQGGKGREKKEERRPGKPCPNYTGHTVQQLHCGQENAGKTRERTYPGKGKVTKLRGGKQNREREDGKEIRGRGRKAERKN